MIETAQDWAVFMDDFGELVTYEAPPQLPIELLGIFTAAQITAASGAGPGIHGVSPVLSIGAAQLSFEPQIGHHVTLRASGTGSQKFSRMAQA